MYRPECPAERGEICFVVPRNMNFLGADIRPVVRFSFAENQEFVLLDFQTVGLGLRGKKTRVEGGDYRHRSTLRLV